MAFASLRGDPVHPRHAIPLGLVAVMITAIGVSVAAQPLPPSTRAVLRTAPTIVASTTTTVPPTTTTTTTAAPPPPPAPQLATVAPRPAPPPAPPPPPDAPIQVPATTELAAARGSIPTFDAPGGHPIGTAGFFMGYPMTMPVLQKYGGWLLVRLPERPNGSRAWVRATDVSTSSTPYRIVLRRAHHRLYLYKGGVSIVSMPAGVGKASTPTPLGSFFIAVNEGYGRPGYGPVVLDTSAHSEAIQSWDGSGDAIIAIHGPISSSSDAQIGANGTAISNGCIRLHIDDQVQLAVVPLGTPVDILP